MRTRTWSRLGRLGIMILLLLALAHCSKNDPFSSNEGIDQNEDNPNVKDDPGATTGGPVLKFGGVRQLVSPTAQRDFVDKSTFIAARNPNIYFIFFDTLRPDTAKEMAPNMRTFFEKNFTFSNSVSSSTATWYVSYSLFHSRPAFETYHGVGSLGDDSRIYGSLFLKILKRLGYQLNMYGFFWDCVIPAKVYTANLWQQFLQSYFGWGSSLINRCPADTDIDVSLSVNKDEVTVSQVEGKLRSTITSPKNNFTFINFYGNHDPYKWGALSSPPYSDNIGDKDTTNPDQLLRRYKNSVAASDVNFKKLMAVIDSLPGANDAVVVLMSDHGEVLYQKGGIRLHGGPPFREGTSSVLSFQLGKNHPLAGNQHADSLATSADIFPTLFDYLQIFPEVPPDWIVGRSLLAHTRKSVLSSKTNLTDPTYEMALINLNQKFWVKVDDRDFFNTDQIRLANVTDYDDKPIAASARPCFQKSESECKEIITRLFPEAINELFPNYVRLPAQVKKTKMMPNTQHGRH